ncbi:MAG TPA: VOC family protein [Stellaceae bacterium]|nr:VOC family protein [Stellaceae bacterium]
MPRIRKITPCLWFDSQAEEAARFYVSLFEESGIDTITYYGSEGFERHGRPAGSVLTVDFRLGGQRYTALNGGPHYVLTPSVSLVVHCASQDEIDHYWDRLGAGGDPAAQACGWLKDRFGLSWQVVPEALLAMIADPDAARTGRVMSALLTMKKLDLAALQRAYNGDH